MKHVLLLTLISWGLSFYQLKAQSFTKITGEKIVTHAGDSRGTSAVDYDNDGDEDLFVTNKAQIDFLYRNNGKGDFTPVNNIDFIKENSTGDHAWGDFNNDGWLDLFITNIAGANHLYQNNGGGSFTKIKTGEITHEIGLSVSVAWADYDNDGYIDLFVGNAYDQNNFLYHNDGGTSFSKITTGPIVNDGGDTRGVVWGDYDNDGFLDLYVTNVENQANFLYHNNRDGTFTKITTGAIVTEKYESFGASWGDYNNDGFLDLYVANHNSGNIANQVKHNSLFTNNQDETFTKVTGDPAVGENGFSAAATWADLDSDGYLDIYIANSSLPNPNRKNSIFINNGQGGFIPNLTGDIANDVKKSQGIAIGDYDLNGKLDVFVGNRSNDNNDLYLNESSSNNWVTIKCEGTISNKAAIGTKVRIKTGNLWQMREIQSTHSYRTHNSLYATFGLGEASSADSLIIEWPSGKVCYFTDLPVNQSYWFQEECANLKQLEEIVQIYPNPTNGHLNISRLLAGTEPIGVSLYDLRGKLIISEMVFRENQFQLDLTRLSAATYILRAEYYGIIQHLKLVKQP